MKLVKMAFCLIEIFALIITSPLFIIVNGDYREVKSQEVNNGTL